MASGVHTFGAPCNIYSGAGPSSSNVSPTPNRAPSGTSQVAYGRTPDPDSDVQPPRSLTSISAMPHFDWSTGPLSHEELRLADYHAGLRLGVHSAAPPNPTPPTQVPMVWQQTLPPPAVTPQPQPPPGLELLVSHGANMAGPLRSAGPSDGLSPVGGANPSHTVGSVAVRHTPAEHGGPGAAAAAAAAAPPAPPAPAAAAIGPDSQPAGSRLMPYCPTLDTSSQPLNRYIISVSAMALYSGVKAQSHEELRWQDRQAGVKGRNDVMIADGTIRAIWRAPYSRTLHVQDSAWLMSISAMQGWLGPQSHEELQWLDRQEWVQSRRDAVWYGAGGHSATVAAAAANARAARELQLGDATAARQQQLGDATAARRAGPGVVTSSGAGPSGLTRNAWTAAPASSAAAPPWVGRPSLSGPGTSPAASPGPASAAAPAAPPSVAASRTATAAPAAAAAAAAPAPGPARAGVQSTAMSPRPRSQTPSPHATATATTGAAGAGARAAATAPGPSQVAAPRTPAATTPTAAKPPAGQTAGLAAGPSTSRAGAASAAAASGSGHGDGGSGMEGTCCVCLEGRAEWGFVHMDAVHLCLCSGCEATARLRNDLRRCYLCNTVAMFCTKVYAT